MKVIIFFVAACGAFLLFSGCKMFPEGEQPKDDIVEKYDFSKTFSTRGAQNYLITSLSTFCLSNYPDGLKAFENFSATDKALNAYPERVVRAVIKTSKFRLAPLSGAEFELTSVIRGENNLDWTMTLIRIKDKNVVWEDHVFIDQSKL